MPSSIAHTHPVTPRPPWAPPLDIARTMARQVLDQTLALDLNAADTLTVTVAFGALQESLRQVLDALDAEDGRPCPSP